VLDNLFEDCTHSELSLTRYRTTVKKLPLFTNSHSSKYQTVCPHGEIDRTSESFLFQFLEPPRQKAPLRLLLREGQRLLIRSTGLGNPP